MALFGNGLKGNLWTGVAIGVGAAVVAPAIIPALGRVVKPVAKSALKGLLILTEKGKEIMATAKKAAPAPAKQKPVQAVQAEKPKLKTLTGKVKEVDTNARIIKIAKKVKGKESETVVNIAERASVKMGREKKRFTDVREGDRVIIRYKDNENGKFSKSLSIVSSQKTVQNVKKIKST